MTIETEAAKLSAKAILRIVLLIAAAALIGVGIWRAYDFAYGRGVAAERHVWVEAQEKAAKEQRAREESAQAASNAAASKADNAAATALAKTSGSTTKRSEAAQREYESNPSKAAPCTPDGRPAAIPPRVLDQLRAARRAAEAAGG